MIPRIGEALGICCWQLVEMSDFQSCQVIEKKIKKEKGRT